MKFFALLLMALMSTKVTAQVGSPAMPASPGSAATTSAQAAAESAEDLRARLLAAIGGRAAWAKATGYYVAATHHVADQAQPFANRIWLDFNAPRVRIESDMASGIRQRSMDLAATPPVAWRVTADGPLPLTAAQVEEDRAWWNGNIYRTFHRLAKSDPDLSLERLSDGRLQVFEKLQPLLWVRLNAAGEPISFATGGPHQGNATIFGPLVSFGGVRFPSFSVRDEGRWRAIIRRFEVSPPLTAERFRP
jgi:hypothetical protein